MTEATFTKLRTSAAFDVVGTVLADLRPGLRLDSATDCTESTKYCGARPVWIWCMNAHNLYLILYSTVTELTVLSFVRCSFSNLTCLAVRTASVFLRKAYENDSRLSDSICHCIGDFSSYNANILTASLLWTLINNKLIVAN